MKKLLLHSCCGPCSTHVIDVLKNDYDITLVYYNPNIHPESEYLHRLHEQERFCKEVGVKIMTVEYEPKEFYDATKGLENEREGGKRCEVCFDLRMRKTAKLAKENGFDLFATTLTVSPHKNSLVISEVGKKIAKELDIDYLDGNFKKQDGYKKSITLAKQYNLYRQNYCGCSYSLAEKERIENEKRRI